jgi:3-oxoacyl-[acyl-carrier-protein] synthase-3
VVTNEELTKLMDTSDEWIRARTGIEERHWVAEGETGVAMARQAALKAMKRARIGPGDLDAIVYATSTPDHFCPGNGVLLQAALGAGTVPALDVRTQCSGFIYGLSAANAWIRSGEYQRILLVGQEIQSTGMDLSTTGRDTAVIFADGAGAAVLGATPDDDHGLLAIDLHGDGADARQLWVDCPGSQYHPRISSDHIAEGRHFLQMNGKEVFRHAPARMSESVRAVLAKAHLTLDEVDLIIPHQANLRISDMLQRNLGVDIDKIYNNIQRYGNTTAATIPIALDECVRSRRIVEGDIVVLTAFGSGFLWGSAVIRW